MKKILLSILALIMLFSVFSETTMAAKPTMSQAKSVYVKVHKNQNKLFSKAMISKKEIYKIMSSHHEKKYIDLFLLNFSTIETGGKTYYYIPDTDFLPGYLWGDEFTWSKKTKLNYYKKKGYEYLIISENLQSDMDGYYSLTLHFRKKAGSKTYKIFDWVYEDRN